MDFDYDENDLENQYEKYSNWEVRIDNSIIDSFEEKYDAIECIIEEINMLSNETAESILIENYIDYDDLINELLNMDLNSFYEYIDCVLSKLDLDNDIKIINLNNEEPEFSEL